MATATVPAIVTYAPTPQLDMRYEQVQLQTSLKDHEVLIEMVATGICHLEILMASSPQGVRGSRYPRILGHEGAGYVRAVGKEVTAARVDDAIVLSYCYCGTCELCATGQLSCCMDFARLNMLGDGGEVFTAKDGQSPVIGKFFGQSSFASLSVVDESCVVNVTGLVENPAELRLFGPLGCGFQTGAGAVTIAGQAQSNDVVIVAGTGAVGMGAIMAAKVARCKAIVAIDRVQARLDLAERFGATHVLNTMGVDNISDKIKELAGKGRISLIIETTGAPSVITALVNCIGNRGRYIQLGVSSDPAVSLSISIDNLVRKRAIIEGISEGSAVAREFIPKMIGWYRDGKFPIDKLIKVFPAKEVSEALRSMEDGSVIKPVLLW